MSKKKIIILFLFLLVIISIIVVFINMKQKQSVVNQNIPTTKSNEVISIESQPLTKDDKIDITSYLEEAISVDEKNEN